MSREMWNWCISVNYMQKAWNSSFHFHNPRWNTWSFDQGLSIRRNGNLNCHLVKHPSETKNNWEESFAKVCKESLTFEKRVCDVCEEKFMPLQIFLNCDLCLLIQCAWTWLPKIMSNVQNKTLIIRHWAVLIIYKHLKRSQYYLSRAT
jgi:hypothetical protein